MTARKLCGFDVNGWRDFVAKNWRSVPGEEEEVGPVEIVPSGPLTSVVNVGDGERSRWIGGAQADTAPHGLGGGWGEVGTVGRRVSVRTLLEMGDDDVAKLSSCFTGSAQGASYNILSIDEGPDGSETAQEHLLEALSVGKYRNGALVWRPVLAALYAIEHGLVLEGQRVGVICQDRRGLAIQQLLIRSAGGVLAPERREAAKHAPSDIGYESLVRAARYAAIGPDGLNSRTAHRAIARSVGKAALGIECPSEMLRVQNGDWETLDLSGYHAAASVVAFKEGLDLRGCDVVLFETLTEGRLKDRIVTNIGSASPVALTALPAQAVALGALFAAHRAGDGAPIFFDVLPRLSTIVYGPDGATNFDLIRPEETLEAGRTYRSPEPASLAIPAGQENISVYLRKEAAPPPRKATVAIGTPLKKQAAVSLWVEQKPAAGRARILLEAQSLGRNFTVEWDDAHEDTRSWEEIIESLKVNFSIPQRLVLPCGMPPWEDSARSDGMLSLLQTEPLRQNPDWDTLAVKLAQRPFGRYCISSDGHLPAEVSQGDIERLDILTKRALEVTRSRLEGETGPGTEDNAALKFLTWQFRRCPPEVASWLIDCIEKSERFHPFVRHQASWVLVYQGLGRIVQGDDTEQRVMEMLLSSDIETWVWNRQSACMAFLLSRSDTAPTLLSRVDVERLAGRAIADFRRNIGEEYTMFNYAPFLLAGLLRWRIENPTALVSGVDPLAADFLAVIEEVEADLANRRRPSVNLQRRRDKILPILKDLKAELLGEGTNPDLLLDIYGAG
ncbi:hypothetical protein [Roseovarius mucosus]|uniref:hypothetical protein n=1 Tax=Roseovarius mucosus TaxID=215743 RepID=UPI003BA96A1E